MKSLDPITKITITHPQNMLKPEINIDTRGINTSTTVPEFKSPKETIDINYSEENNIVNVDISNKIEERIFTDKSNRDIAELIKDLTNPNALWKHIDYRYVSEVYKPHWAFNFEQYTPATLLPKKYADDKLQYKLIAGNNITIDENTNAISATGGSGQNWKEVAVTENFMTINYNLKNDKYYRVFYALDERSQGIEIGYGTYKIINFLFKDNDSTNIESETIISRNTDYYSNWLFINITIQVSSRGIFLLNYYPPNHNHGYLWKLEELQ